MHCPSAQIFVAACRAFNDLRERLLYSELVSGDACWHSIFHCFLSNYLHSVA